MNDKILDDRFQLIKFLADPRLKEEVDEWQQKIKFYSEVENKLKERLGRVGSRLRVEENRRGQMLVFLCGKEIGRVSLAYREIDRAAEAAEVVELIVLGFLHEKLSE